MRGITQITGRINPQDIQHTVGFDWKDQLMRKYPQFTIKSEYDDIIFTPVHVVIDTHTKKVYKVPHNKLIITIRDKKINTINDSKI
jgi:hypothetical protein